ncbi:hypothetical protein CTA2_2160 [Colletotrichum tanaceti]|nr:hypothetical protein CTA2_2160 [Colletotrichum tanaceti]
MYVVCRPPVSLLLQVQHTIMAVNTTITIADTTLKIVNHPSLTKSARHGHGRENAEWRAESTCQTRNGQWEALECSLPCVPRWCASQDIKGLSVLAPKLQSAPHTASGPFAVPPFPPFPMGAFPTALRLEPTPWPPFCSVRAAIMLLLFAGQRVRTKHIIVADSRNYRLKD